jgi:hypothetical protein
MAEGWANFCHITLDGTDFAIYEPQPFSSNWYLHKLYGPAACYELGVCIKKGWVVWANGPYEAGECSDL